MGYIDKAIENAKEFIFSNKDDEDLWRDFKIRNYGESVDWVSSYVGFLLLQSGVPSSKLESTARLIVERRNDEYAGWGFDEKVVPDADSTAFTVLFLSYFQYREEINKSRSFLLRHQKPDGSFGTYIPELIKPYIAEDTTPEGWCSGIPDITATVLRALGNNRKAIEYMKRSQQQEGFWRSYWYNDDIYSTTQAILALKSYDCKEQTDKAQKWLSQKLNSDTPFYLALSLRGVMDNKKYRDEVRQGIENLLRMQVQNGGWDPHPTLRFPAPSNTEPWRNPDRLREEAKDQKGLFTTATCLHTLHKYSAIF